KACNDYIDPRRVPEFAKDVDGIVRPKRNAVGKSFDQCQMEGEIAEIVWRLDLIVAAVDVEQPAKGSDGKHREAHGHCPEPHTAIPHDCRPSACTWLAFRLRSVPRLLFPFRRICSFFATC